MNKQQTRQYEMLLRLRDFGNSHGDLFAESTSATEAFASVNAAINELTTTDLVKLSASVSARADRQTIARKSLTELLLRASQLARVLRARGVDVGAFELPESKSDQTLLTAARQFAQDAARFEAEFVGHGVAPTVIAESTAAFDKALRDRGMNRSGHKAAGTRIRDLIRTAMLDVRRLDLIVESVLANNHALRTSWKDARRVLRARGSYSSAAAGAAPSPAPEPAADLPVPSDQPAASVPAPSQTEDAPKPATVIEMPSREMA